MDLEAGLDTQAYRLDDTRQFASTGCWRGGIGKVAGVDLDTRRTTLGSRRNLLWLGIDKQ